MNIHLVKSTGTGSTELSAFDKALINAGIENTNLILLSSVIPPNPKLIHKQIVIKEQDYGKRLYVVMAENRTKIKGKNIAAGIGWVLEKNNKFGLFVEHHGNTHGEVKKLIHKSLQTMMKNRPKYEFLDINCHIEEADCKNEPTSVLACAIYKLEVW